MTPLKKHCIQQVNPFQDSTDKVVSASKTVLHHKSNTFFENALAPILNSCTGEMIVLNASNLTFALRSKLAGIVVNHNIHRKGLQYRPTNADVCESANAIIAHFPSEKIVNTFQSYQKHGILLLQIKKL
ncbi:uncharacterized protein LOC136087755 [Hydra vulgaris]|uniref:Uncharacterized protein LOC136087755 n=1 Tax=Hydra vulgaris TaxID=6087 RepID=A0ABM4CZ62_HYDVU